jgi:DNA-binding SARP family transcriptional activator/WD40 repeat protein
MDEPPTLVGVPGQVYSGSMVHVGALGIVEASRGGRSLPLGGPKQRTVLALLVAGGGRPVQVGTLIDALWGESAGTGAKGTLQTYVSNLRGVLGDDVVVWEGGSYRLALPRGQVDVWAFEDGVAEGRSLLSDRPVEAAAVLRRALERWRGHPYADAVGSAWLDAESRRLAELRLNAVEDRIEAELTLGNHGQLVGELDALAAEHPLRERFRGQQMVALYRCGRQAEALQAYQRTRAHLVDELGIDPSPPLQALHDRILTQDPTLLLEGSSRIERLAVLVADIDESSELWQLGAGQADRVLAGQLAEVAAAVERAGGRSVQLAGTGAAAAFGDVSDAVEAAHTALEALRQRPGASTGPVLGMAIDVGDVDVRAAEYAGPPVSRALRLAAAAHPEQIVLSDAAHAALSTAGGAGWQVRALGQHRLAGLEPLQVFQLVVAGRDRFPPLRVDAPERLAVAAPGGENVRGYELRERALAGGVMDTYRAYQPSVGREVAVKVLRGEHVNRPAFVARFEFEARLIARLEHPHILPLFDFWRDPDGAYLVVPWLRGGSLRDVVHEGPLEVPAALAVLDQIGSALAYAHAHGVLHRAIEPSNVLLDEDEHAYLTGFAIGPHLPDRSPGPSSGSDPAYVAPEELAGEPLTARADVYGLGMLAFELLSGRRPPMDGPLPSVAESRPALRGEIDAVVARATADDPEQRHPDVASLLAALTEAAGIRHADVARPLTAARNPYKGLHAFTEADAADFHGRDAPVEEVLTAISRHRLVAVVGPSGIGKSSLLRAGVLPALRDGAGDRAAGWLATDLVPGAHPFEALGSALLRVAVDRRAEELTGALAEEPATLARTARRILPADRELVVVIDQFEELFAQVGEDLRGRFLDALTTATSDPDGRLRIVVALRADFLDRPLRYPAFARLLRDALVTVTAPSEEELAEAVRQPAASVGVDFEPGLVERIVRDVGGEPGALPLLQYALTELFDRRAGDVISARDYEAIGGVTAALGRRAEEVHAALAPEERAVARDVFLRLVSVEEGPRDTRRRVRRRELDELEADTTTVEEVLSRFGAHRLLAFDRDDVTRSPTVEVAHEALIAHWDRLRGWIDDRREDLLLRDRLRHAVREWAEHDHDVAYLIAGGRLEHFERWAERADLTLTREERRLIDDSRRAEDARDARLRRRRQVVMSGFGAAAAVMLVLAVVAYAGQREAIRQAASAAASADEAASERDAALRAEERAEAEALRARAGELAASATAALATDAGLAKLLALASATTAEPSLDTIAVLHQAYEADRIVGRYAWPDEEDNGWLGTDLHPDGSRLVAAGEDVAATTYLEVADLTTGRVLWSYETARPEAVIDSPSFSIDGATVVAGVYWRAWETDPEPLAVRFGFDAPRPEVLGAYVWDSDTGELLRRFDLGPCGGWVHGLSDTHLLATRIPPGDDARCLSDAVIRNHDFPIVLVDLASGEERQLAARGSWWAAMSADGRYVAFDEQAGDEPVSVVADAHTGERVLTYPTKTGGISDMVVRALNDDGSLLLAGDRPIVVWDVPAGEIVAEFDGHGGESLSAVFAPDGRTVLSSGRDGTLRRWSASSGEELASFPAVGSGRVAPHPDGRVLVADPTDGRARLVDTSVRGEAWAVPTCPGFVIRDSLNRAGEQLALSVAFCGDGTAHTYVIDVDAREVASDVPGYHGQDMRLSPDGTRFVRQEVGEPPVPPDDGDHDWVSPIRVRDSRSGELLVELEGMCVWDRASGTPRSQQEGCAAYPSTPFPVWNWKLRWSPDGSRIAAAIHPATGGMVLVWDTDSGRLVGSFDDCPEGVEGLIFSPDGRELLVSCRTVGTVVRLSTDTWDATETVELDVSAEGRGTLGFVGYTADGSDLVVLGGASGIGTGSVHWLDAATLDLEHSESDVHDASPKSWAMSPGGTLAATGASDGVIKVWDVEAREQVHEIRIGETQVQGVAFVGEHHLAVSPQEGGVFVYTLDVEELVELTRASLTRGFTGAECRKFGFDDDCPTLENLVAGG